MLPLKILTIGLGSPASATQAATTVAISNKYETNFMVD